MAKMKYTLQAPPNQLVHNPKTSC